jgi:hypothetical protein
MAYVAIAGIAPQYENYPNWWLKAYEQGTTTPLAMALDADGVTTVSKLELDLNGFINTDGNAKVIPYLDEAYDLWLIPTEADANANDLTNAVQVADNIDNFIRTVSFANYDDLRAIGNDSLVDGQTLTVTDESIGGQGVLRNVVGHGLTNTGRVIVIDADWYWYRINGGPTQLKWLAVEGGADETANVQTVIDYVRLTGGVLDISGNYNVTSVSLDLSNGIALTGRGSLVGIATVATDAVLTVKNVVNVAIDGAWFINGNYNTNYSEAVWVYTDGVGQQAAFIDITNLTPVNTRLAWKFGNPNRPQDLVSEITIRGGHTFGCPSAVEAHGAQTVVNFVGCNLASLTGSGDAAWQALPQRTIVSHGATINIVGGELLHVLLSTGGTGGDFNALCVSSAFDLGGGSSQYGKILVNGAVVECGSRFAVSENTAALPTPDSGYIGFVGCQGVSTNTTLAIAETDASYAGTIRFSNNEFFASNPRAVSNVIAGNDGCDIYVDEGSFGDKFLTGLSTIIGGTVHFSNRLIGYYSNVAGQSVPNASATVLAFTDVRAGNDLSRFNGSHTAGVFTVPVGGLKSVFVKAQFLLAGLTTANSEFYIQLNGLSVGVSKNDTYQDGSVFLGDLSAGDTIRVVMQNSAAGALTAGSNATDFMQISASN